MPATDPRSDETAQRRRGPASSRPVASSPCEGVLSGLVARCGRGDRDSLGTLFDLTHGIVSATVRRRLSADTARRDLDDAVVEVYREVWRRAPQFRVGVDDPLRWMLDSVDRGARSAALPRPFPVAS
ncbi:hypothetical protein [Nocardioides lijunqiniae]|uniref:hypothetical protein n=1 Tax=Nocardioides lijunqiniae TaxID=2760832 RepID=UPI001878A059|nr:hypothetical protein [Nocardioides lijunqiniae]